MIACAYGFGVVAVFSRGLICVGALIACAGCLFLHWNLDRARGTASPRPTARRGGGTAPPAANRSLPHSHPVYGMSDDDAYRTDPYGDVQ